MTLQKTFVTEDERLPKISHAIEDWFGLLKFYQSSGCGAKGQSQKLLFALQTGIGGRRVRHISVRILTATQ